MKNKETAVVKVQEAYRSNFVNIVLAVVSIVQGLAFNDLAQRFPKIYSSEDWTVIAHFILCFVLLLRIFQTYVTAALDYENWDLGFIDIFIIFVAGLLEYLVFSSLIPGNFNISDFHQRFLILCTLAFIGYARAIAKLYWNRFSGVGVPRQYYEAEIRLQIVNLLVVAIAMSISVYILQSAPSPRETYPVSYTYLSLLIALIMGLNTFYSLRSTFSRPKIEITQLEKSAAPESEFETVPPSNHIENRREDTAEKIIPKIRRAERQDVEQLLTLITDNFSYVYETLFDTSPRLTKRIVRAVLLALGGRHEWGYQGFYVAADEKTDKALGLIKMETMRKGINFNRIVSRFILAIVLIRHIGLVGLARTLKNLRNTQSAISPIFRPDELYIDYIAVDNKHTGKSIGKELVDFACKTAKEDGKDCVALDVRKKNRKALSFFGRQGFLKVSEIESEYDYLFERGHRISMRKEL